MVISCYFNLLTLPVDGQICLWPKVLAHPRGGDHEDLPSARPWSSWCKLLWHHLDQIQTLSPPDPRYQQTSMTSQLTEMPQRSAKNVKVALAWVQGMNRLDCTLVAKYSKQNTKMFPQHRKRRVWAPAMSSRSPICSRKATTSGEDRPVRAKQRLEGARKRESISSTCPINFQFNIYIYYIYIHIYI